MFIDSLDHKGRGITRLDNKITFVNNALVGEEVDIVLTRSKKKYNEAKVINYYNRSKDRVDYSCSYYDNCGGCHIGHMIYDKQLKFKQDKVTNIVSHYLDKNIIINNIIYDKQFNYRNKLTLQVKDNKIGMYKLETNDIVQIDKCLITNDVINDKIKYLNKLNLNSITRFIIRVSGEEVLLIIDGPKNTDIEPIYNNFDNIVIKDGKYYLKKGNDYVLQKLDDKYYKISLDSFFQVNYNVMKKMYKFIRNNCIKSQNVLDLYCGTGSIGLYVSDIASSVEGIEINQNAINDANYNKKINGIDNIKFKCSDTKNIQIDKYYETIVVDPPRQGLNKHIISEILKAKPRRIIYVSCDPFTLVRDLKDLNKMYSIHSITPFDMFPNTFHVECVVVLNING